MSWKLKSKPSSHKVTRPLATRFATADPCPNDRPLSERRMQVYRQLFEKGQFRPCTWATAHCLETGLTYRVNGKHTSTLLASLEEIPEYYVLIEEYICDTLDDVAHLYSTFDSKTQSRSNKEIYLSFAGAVPSLAEVCKATIQVTIAGIGYHLWGQKYYDKPVADRAELIIEHAGFALWLEQELDMGSRKGKHLLRGPVVSAMFATYQKDKEAARSFWLAVRDETGPSPDLPDRKLARYLLMVGVDTGSGSRRKEKASVHEIYVRCLQHYNGWRRGEIKDYRYSVTSKIPEVE